MIDNKVDDNLLVPLREEDMEEPRNDPMTNKIEILSILSPDEKLPGYARYFLKKYWN